MGKDTGSQDKLEEEELFACHKDPASKEQKGKHSDYRLLIEMGSDVIDDNDNAGEGQSMHCNGNCLHACMQLH